MSDTPRTREDAFLERLRAHDPEAFTRLVGEYHKTLVAVARSMVGDTWAEEVVQDAWIAIYRALPDFAGRSSLRTWLYTIVRNAARTRLRKEKRQVSLDDGAGDPESGNMEEWLSSHFDSSGMWRNAPGAWGIETAASLLEEEELQHCIEKTLERLSPKQRSVLILRDMEQQELEEICNILDISHSNVRVLLHRARVMLRQVIDTYMEKGEC